MKGKLKTILILIAVIVLVAVAAVGGYYAMIKAQEKSALKRVDDIFIAIKSGDEDEIKKYIDLNDSDSKTKNTTDQNKSTEGVVNDKEMLKVITQNINYEVEEIDTKWNDCNIKLSVSNKDFKTIFSGYISKAFALAFSTAFSGDTDEDKTEKELEEYFKEQYNSDSVQTVKNEVEFNMKKNNGDWEVDYDKNALLNAIMPGFSEISKSLEALGAENKN